MEKSDNHTSIISYRFDDQQYGKVDITQEGILYLGSLLGLYLMNNNKGNVQPPLLIEVVQRSFINDICDMHIRSIKIDTNTIDLRKDIKYQPYYIVNLSDAKMKPLYGFWLHKAEGLVNSIQESIIYQDIDNSDFIKEWLELSPYQKGLLLVTKPDCSYLKVTNVSKRTVSTFLNMMGNSASIVNNEVVKSVY